MRGSVWKATVVLLLHAIACASDSGELTEAETLAAEKRKAFLINYYETELREVEAAKPAARKSRNRDEIKRLVNRQRVAETRLAESKRKTLVEHHADLVDEIRRMREVAAIPPPKLPRKWYEGGTLHRKDGLAWQAATPADRLATCADFVAKAWTDGLLKDRITRNFTSIDDTRRYAQELCDFLDAAFAVDPDPMANEQAFRDREVTEAVVSGMILMGWFK